MANPLVLSSVGRLVQWLQLDDELEAASVARLAAIDVNTRESVDIARESVTAYVREEYQSDDDYPVLPSRMHRACLMLAAKFYRREDSIYGESYVVGGTGDALAIIRSDPDIRDLLSTYKRPGVGSYTIPLPSADEDVRSLEAMMGSSVLRGGRAGSA